MDGLEEPRRRSVWGTFVLVATLIVLLVIAIFLPPLISLGHYRRSITTSISVALGRPVYVGAMQLRLLPMPGITMTDFTVEEDPRFGYEPALHANSVVASLRLSSLWRGRLEVSRISLDEASLNLIRKSSGQWSIGSVLLRASQIPNAPTAQRHAGGYARFPYIEASDARIDFKQDAEKKPFSLMNAEFSMWQENGGEWRLRLEAQPVRTDLELHLSDTGQLSVEGSLRRASDLSAMPVDLQATWSGAQLGQVSLLLTGIDSGWRGDLSITTAMRGTAGDLQLRSQMRVSNLRRQEFQPATTIDVNASCQSEYRPAERIVENLTCFSPVGAGHMLLTGSIQGWLSPKADLAFELNQIPASLPAAALGLMRPRLQNVTATGTINGSFHLKSFEGLSVSGDATTTAIGVSWPGGALGFPSLHVFSSPLPPLPRTKRHPSSQLPAGIQLQTFAMPFGEPDPLTVDAQFTRSEFEVHVAGSASLARLAGPGETFGLIENSLNMVGAKGRADLNITAKGSWIPPLSSGGPRIATSGSIHLQGVDLRPAFLRTPVEVATADVVLTPDKVSWQNVALRFQRMAMRGSIQFPVHCMQETPCPAIFTLQSESLSAGALNSALAGSRQGFLGQMLANALGQEKTSAWPPLRGSIQCAAFSLGKLTLDAATAAVTVSGRKLSIESADGSTLGGMLHASGEMDVASGVPNWNLDVRLTGARPGVGGEIFREQWGAGVVNGEARLTMKGYSTPDLASSANGDVRFTWQNGGLASASEGNGSPLEHFDRWSASGTVADGLITLASGGLSRSGRLVAVRGTISFDRQLNLSLQTRRGPIKIGGTLAHPVLATVAGP